ncbi:hypothetical protein GO685_00580 [Wolbachia endosymbiont of Madathamugadia hiepei]|nr:hypothetical protein [Wolbachia endosymbiont of Madathamugadia hiepei]
MLCSALVYDQFFWIPVSGHWDDTRLVVSNHNACTVVHVTLESRKKRKQVPASCTGMIGGNARNLLVCEIDPSVGALG